MAKKPDSFVKGLTVNLPASGKLCQMIHADEDLEAIIEQALLEKECIVNYEKPYQDGKTGKEILDGMGYAEILKNSTFAERQKIYSHMAQIFAVASDINEDDEDYDYDDDDE
jgi:hypothetical protein